MNILEKIVEQKKLEIAALPKRPASAEHLRWAVKTHGQRRDFATQLRFPRHGKAALIAEVKKASPSAGRGGFFHLDRKSTRLNSSH